MKPLTGVAIVLAAAALVVLALGDDEESDETLTFTVTETQDTSKVNDVPPVSKGGEELTVGDSLLITADLTGEREGRAVIECTSASEHFEVVCEAIYKLEDGDVVLAGSPNLAEEETAPFEIAVVGGTGAYNGLSGTMIATQTEGRDVQSDEFQLLLPDD